MQTHLHLIHDQLDLLMSFLVQSTGALFAKPQTLNNWQYDDLQALAAEVDNAAERYLTASQRLQDGYSLIEVGDDLLAPLQAILERSSALLYDDTLPAVCSQRLQRINDTSYDMFNIVNEIFDL
jgi:hypothetical protein